MTSKLRRHDSKICLCIYISTMSSDDSSPCHPSVYLAISANIRQLLASHREYPVTIRILCRQTPNVVTYNLAIAMLVAVHRTAVAKTLPIPIVNNR